MNGLAASEAAERLARDGPNLLVPQAHKPFNDWMRPVLVGGVLSLAVLVLYLSEFYQGMSGDLARSTAIIAMVSGQSVIV
jgi:hypothetical protein